MTSQVIQTRLEQHSGRIPGARCRELGRTWTLTTL
jgi:hypothetical protein